MLTKEQQKAASDRIMAKLGPLDAQEQVTYDLLTRRVEDYLPPDPESGERTCGICGEMFAEIPATRETAKVTALEQHSDHMAEHNPSAAQWGEAHRRIQRGRELSKNADKG